MGELIMKRCPHCNGEAGLYANYSYKKRKYFVFVKCEVCGSQGKILADDNDPEQSNWNDSACDGAVRAWNLRYKEGAE